MPHRSFPDESASGQILDIHHSGLKATGPRIKILRTFQTGERRHWTAEEVYHQLLAAGASVGLLRVQALWTLGGRVRETSSAKGVALEEVRTVAEPVVAVVRGREFPELAPDQPISRRDVAAVIGHNQRAGVQR